jgi:uncharacterized protein (DUF1499 family)
MANPTKWQWVAFLALVVTVTGAALLALAGPGYQMGWWTLGTGLQQMLRWGAYAGIAGAVLGLLGIVLNPPGRAFTAFLLSLVALVGGMLIAGIPWQWQRTAQQVPRIHDITTDTVTPPTFDAIVPRRAGANPLDYTEAKAEAQREGYPTLGPLMLEASPADAYARALALVGSRGWELVADSADTRVIEATDTTRWFGFKDDVVIRVSGLPDGGSRVDVRSVSRVGRSDVGTNARRIQAFLADLER